MLTLDKLKTRVGILDKSTGASTANTSLMQHAQKMLALNEGDMPYAVSMQLLDVLAIDLKV